MQADPVPTAIGRARRPAAPVVGALLLVGAAIVAAALALHLSGNLASSGLAVALLTYTGICLCVAARAGGMPRFGVPNTLTLLRAGLAGLIAGIAADLLGTDVELGMPAMWIAVCLALLALVTDWLDGRIARRTGSVSAFGGRFDMEIDALLILTLSVLVLALGKAGIWVLAIGLLRYAFLLAGGIVPRLRRDLPESSRRKAVCVLVVVALVACASPLLQPPLAGLICAATLLALAWSFGLDIGWALAAPARAGEAGR